MATPMEYPATDHLWQTGFNLEHQVSRLDIPLSDEEGNVFSTEFTLTAYPERGEARRLFGRKGPAASSVKSNYDIDYFRLPDSMLTAIYREKAAVVLLEMLSRENPAVSRPRVEVSA